MQMYKFEKRENAQSFINRAKKIWMLVLGDDNRFWAVRPVDAERLIRQGYSLA